MMKLVTISVLTLTVLSCNQDSKDKTTEKIEVTDIDISKEEIKELKKERTHDYAFPKNYVVIEMGTAGDDFAYYFYPDNSLLTRDLYHEHSYRTGFWSLKNDTIRLDFNKRFGKRGLGSENIPEGMETVETNMEYSYDEYANYSERINSAEIIILSNLMNKNWFRIDSTKFASDYKIDTNDFKLDGDYVEASTRILDTNDLAKYSSEELRLMRNEIFARYDYIFKSQDLREYFGPKDWYMPNNKNIDSYLTEIEKKNIELILKLEQ